MPCETKKTETPKNLSTKEIRERLKEKEKEKKK